MPGDRRGRASVFDRKTIQAAARILAWRLTRHHEGALDAPLYGSDLDEETLGSQSPEEVFRALREMVHAGDFDRVRQREA